MHISEASAKRGATEFQIARAPSSQTRDCAAHVDADKNAAVTLLSKI